MHQRDRNLVHEDETDIMEVLRAKHARIQENNRMRSPSQSRLQSRNNSIISAHSQLSTVTEVPTVTFDPMPNKTKKSLHAVANGVAGKTPSPVRANGTTAAVRANGTPALRPRGSVTRSRQVDDPENSTKESSRRNGNQLNNQVAKNKRVNLKKNIDNSSETFDNSSDPDQNLREGRHRHRPSQNEAPSGEDDYDSYENRGFVMGENYRSMPRSMPRSGHQNMRSHSFSPGSLQDRHGYVPRQPMMYRPPPPHMYGPDGPYGLHPDAAEPGIGPYSMDHHPSYPPEYPGDMYPPMGRPYMPPSAYMYEPPYDYTGRPHSYGGPPPFYPSSPYAGYPRHPHTPQLHHRQMEPTGEAVYNTGPIEMSSLPLLDMPTTPSSGDRRFATVIHVGDTTGGMHRRSTSSTKLWILSVGQHWNPRVVMIPTLSSMSTKLASWQLLDCRDWIEIRPVPGQWILWHGIPESSECKNRERLGEGLCHVM